MTGPRQPEERGFLALPNALATYLLSLPRDYPRLALVILRQANWERGLTPSGVLLDAGEALISYRSRPLWEATGLTSVLDEGQRLDLMKRFLERLERDGFIARRSARDEPTQAPTQKPPRRNTPATVVRFLKYREILWPRGEGEKHEVPHERPRGTTTIQPQNQTSLSGHETPGPVAQALAEASPVHLPL